MVAQKKKAVSKRKPPAKPRGRPTKLTVSVSARIVKAVSLGMTFKEAAKAGGIHEHTLEKWRKRSAKELTSSGNSGSIYTPLWGR